MSDNQTLKFRLLLPASPQQVYAALTRAGALTTWLCNVAEIDAREGGRIYLWWQSGYYSSGEFLRLTPGEKIVFTWQGRNEPGASVVKISLEAQEDGGTLLKLNHSEIGEGKIWKLAAREFQKGWLAGLENLKATLETGQDLRLVRRPMLGVSGLDEMTPALAESLGVPFVAGIRLHGTVEGFGAHAAGLQKDDILVKLGGEKIANYGDLVNILQGLKAGDEIKVSFYRGGEKQAAQLTLSARPMPEQPATLSELSARLKTQYSQSEKALAKLLIGLTPAEADFQPDAQAWNIKHVLCHLIVCERALHDWLTGMIEGRDPNPLFYHSNRPEHVQVMSAAYRTHGNLFQEFKRSVTQTLGLLAALPAETTANKSTFWQLCLNLAEGDHLQAHLGQIQELLAQARQPAAPAPTDTPPTPETSEAP